MGERLTLSIRGQPRAKGRARAFGRVVTTRDGPRAVVRLVTPQDTRDAEEFIRWEFRASYPRHVPWVGPIMLRFTAVFPMLQSFTAAQTRAALAGELYHTAKPDKDNLEKLICDALNGLAWVDDAQLQGGGVKRYGRAERLDITLELLHQPVTTPSDARRAKAAAQPRLQL